MLLQVSEHEITEESVFHISYGKRLCRIEGVINKKEYPELPEIKQEFIDQKVLEFDHRGK